MPLSDEEIKQLQALGWLSPSTASGLGSAGQAALNAPPGTLTMTPAAVSPDITARNQLAAANAGLGNIPGITAPVAVTPPPALTPKDAPPGGWPAGQGLSHANPTGPLATPSKPPVTLEDTIRMANAGRPPPKEPVAADVKKPQAPPGSLPTDAATEGTVSIPVIKRGGTPPTQAPTISGGGVGAPTGPAQPKPPSAADEYLKMLQDTQKRQDERADKVVNAFEAQQLAEREKNVAVAAGKLEATATAEKQLQESNARLAAARAQSDDADRESQRRALELANRKIDPDRYWHQKSTGERILGAIALAIGTFGSAISKTPNYAFQMVENSIDRDIAAQREDIQNAKDSAAMLDKISKDKYGRAMSAYELESRQRLDSYNYALQKIDAAAAKYDDPIAAAKAEQLKAQLMDKIDQTKVNIATNVFEVKSAQEAARLKAQQAAAAAAAAHSKEQKEQIKEYRALVQKNMENGDDLNVAQARALAVMGGPGAFKGNLPTLPGKPEPGSAPKAGDPVSFVPKHQQTEAIKEQSDFAKAEKSVKNVDKMFDQWRQGSAGIGATVTGSQRDLIKANIAVYAKGTGMNSDKDYDFYIKPNIPELGDSDETLARKQQALRDAIISRNPTPILDRHAPGWRALQPDEATEAGKTQFGFKPAAK